MPVVAVSGYFDPLQPGHLELFRFAKEYIPGSSVVVITHGPEVVLKKSKFYIYDFPTKKALLKKLPWVDMVIEAIDKDGSVTKTLDYLKPQFYIKGPDRNAANMPRNELEVCERIGCQIIYQKGAKEGSSTAIKVNIMEQLCS